MLHLQNFTRSTNNELNSTEATSFNEAFKIVVSSNVAKVMLLSSALLFTGCDDKQQTETSDHQQQTHSNTVATNSIRAKATPIETVSYKGNDQIEGMIHLQKQWKVQSLDALKLFQQDPKVAELIAFFEKNAFFSIPNGPTMTMTLEQDEKKTLSISNPLSFEVVYMPESYAESMPSSAFANGKTIRILTTFKTKEWLALILTHEISHIEDKLIHGENPNNEREYLIGEVKAHLKEMEMLKGWDNNAYNTLIAEGIPLYSKHDVQGLIALAAKLYPLGANITSNGETNLGTASCIVAIAFEKARKEGKSDIQLHGTYKEVRKFLGN